MLSALSRVGTRAISRHHLRLRSRCATRPLHRVPCLSAGHVTVTGSGAIRSGDWAWPRSFSTSSVTCGGGGGGALPPHQKVVLPALSPTMESGSLISWEKAEGDRVAEGDLLAEVETDKATMGFESSDEGYLAKILVPAGTKDIPLGRLLCIIVENKDDIAKFESYTADESDSADQAQVATATAPAVSPPTPPAQQQQQQHSTVHSILHSSSAPAPPPAAAAAGGGGAAVASGGDAPVMASPRARQLAAERGVDISRVAAGSDGIVRGEHVLAATSAAPGAAPAAAAAAPAAPTPHVDLDITGMRKTIAKRLVHSKHTVPHYYLTAEVCMDTLISVRQTLNAQLAAAAGSKDSPPVKLSFNDFIIKAAALACLRVPETNSAWLDTCIRQYSSVDISVAVSTEHGLITPIVFGAERRGLADISATVRELAARARQRRLAPHEFQGGTFSVSNLGMFGVTSFSAIINPPQACILAVGSTEHRLVPPSAAAAAKGDTGPLASRVMTVTLSCDHRVVDGAVGARWLAEFRQCMEQPVSMML